MTVRQLDAEALYRNLLASVQRSLAGRDEAPVAIVGIRTGGVWVAERLQADLGIEAAQGVLTSAFHRDDHNTRGIPTTIGATRLDFPVADSRILLVDRGGRQLPLQADHVGGRVDVGPDERLVLSQETSGRLALRIEPAND